MAPWVPAPLEMRGLGPLTSNIAADSINLWIATNRLIAPIAANRGARPHGPEHNEPGSWAKPTRAGFLFVEKHVSDTKHDMCFGRYLYATLLDQATESMVMAYDLFG
jgi:hypothetical protein